MLKQVGQKSISDWDGIPSYSPELNLDEYLDGNLKNKVHSGKQIRNQEDIEKSPVHLCGLSLNGLLMSVIISSTQE